MIAHLGDKRRGQLVYAWWNTYQADGASVTRATNGTISVYKIDDNTQTTTGVTDTEDADGLTGVHRIVIDTSNAFYAEGNDFAIVLSAATIDGKVVNSVLAMFSIENAFNGEASRATAQSIGANQIQLAAGEVGGDGARDGDEIYIESATTGAKQRRTITTSVAATDICGVNRDWNPLPTGTIKYRRYASSKPLTLLELATAMWQYDIADSVDVPDVNDTADRLLAYLVAKAKNKQILTKATGVVKTRTIGDTADIMSRIDNDLGATYVKGEES